jgi:L-arabinose transport system substrate-binding protein
MTRSARGSLPVAISIAAGLCVLAGCPKAPAPAPPTGQTTARTPAGEASGESKIVIGFLVKMPEEPWFQNEWKFAQQCADKYGFDLKKIGATDGEKVMTAIDNLATAGAQGFVICTPDVKLGPAIMAKATQHNMKVFSVDDQFVGADGKFMDVTYMGISASDIGHQVGEALSAEMKKRGWKPAETGAAAITFDELNTGKERTDGATDALIKAGFPKDRVFRAPEKTTDVPGAFDAASTLLTQHPEVKHWLAFALNDEGVLGAVRAMEGRGLKVEDIIGVGIGGTSALPEFDKPKPTGFFATCLIDPYRHGYETTELLYKWIKDGTPPPKDTRTKGTIVTRETCRKTMQERGLI